MSAAADSAAPAPAPSPAADGPAAGGPPARRVLAAAVVANVLGVIDVNVAALALPSMLRSFPGATLPGLSWVMNAYTVVFAAALLPAGAIADRFGARRIFLAAVGVFAAGSLACAAAPGAGWLIAARMLQALGGGAMITLAISIGLAALPGRPGQVFGLISGVGGLAAAAGPSIGAALLALGGWRAIFLATVPPAAAVIALAWPARREGRGGGERPAGLPDLAGTACTAGSVAALALLAGQAPAWGWLSGRSLAAAAAAVLLGGLAVARSLRHPRPAVDLSLLRSQTTRSGNLALALVSVPQFTVVLCATLFLTERGRLSVPAAGLVLTPGMGAASLAAWGGGRLVRRAGARRVAAAGAAVGIAGWVWIALSGGVVSFVVPGLMLGLAGAAALAVAVSAIAVSAVPAASYGTGSALVMLSRAVGAAIGVAALARLLVTPSPGHFRAAWLGMAAAMALAGVLALTVRTGPRRAEGS